MEIPECTIYTLMADAALRQPHLPAYEFLGRKTTFLSMLQQIDRIARGFSAIGIGQGDRVAICLPNCPQAVLSFYALNRLGAVSVMLHPLSAPTELASALDLTRAEVLLAPKKLASAVQQTRRKHLITVLVPLPGEFPTASKAGQLSWRRLLTAGQRINLPPDRGQSRDPALILFSGGTGGVPKAVLHTNRSCNAAALQLLQGCGLAQTAGLRMLSLLPLFHGFGLIVGIHTPLLGGACCVLIPRFRIDDLGRLLLKTRPQLLPAVPAMLEALRTDPRLDGEPLHFLQGIYCGGDTITAGQKQRLEQFFAAHGASVPIRLGYGLTECVAAACLTPPDRRGTALQPLDGMTVSVCRPGTDTELPPGAEGEICLTGPSLMVKYLQNPETTDEALRRHPDGRLWLHTGDLGILDENGLLRFSRRKKRLIITGGYNVDPCRLEAVLQTHPGVRQACVIGIPDSCRGQQVKAIIVAARQDLTEDALHVYCRQRIARFALPRSYEFRTALPLTAMGKTDWRALEREYGNRPSL